MRARLRVSALLSALVALALLPAAATALSRVQLLQTGPSGAGPAELSAGHDPGVVWGLGARRVYRSGDGGATWQSVLRVPDRYQAEHVAVDPSVSGTAYLLAASPLGDRVIRTTDDGATWQAGRAIPDPDGADYFGSLSVDPSTPGRLWYVPTYTNGPAHVFRSDDGGATWTLPGATIDGAAGIGSANGEVWSWNLFQVLKSVDGGETFTSPVTALLPGGLVDWIEPDPTQAGVVYGAFQPFFGAPGASTAPVLYRSTDDGGTWLPVNGGLPAGLAVARLAFGGGRTLAALRTQGTASSLYAGGAGIYELNGGSWSALNDGFPATEYATGLTADSAGSFYASPFSGAGAYALAPAATTWQHRGSAAEERVIIADLLANPWTGGLDAATPLGLLERSGPSTWTPLGSGMPADARVRRVLAAGAAGMYALVDGVGIDVSHDHGATWAPTAGQPPAPAALSDIAASPRVLLATDGTLVWRSADRGATWHRVLDMSYPGGGGFFGDAPGGIALVGKLHRVGLAFGAGGFWVSQNGGRSWHAPKGPAAPYASYGLATDSGPDGTVYAGTNGIALSSDGGRRWQPADLFTQWLGPIAAIAADPAHRGVVWAADDVSLWRSADGGVHWRRLAALPAGAYVSDLSFDADGVLHVGTYTDGVIDVVAQPFERLRPTLSIRSLRRGGVGHAVRVAGRTADRGGAGVGAVEYNLVVQRAGKCWFWRPRWLSRGGEGKFEHVPCATARSIWIPVRDLRRGAGRWSLQVSTSIAGRWRLRVRAIDRETNRQRVAAVRSFTVG